MRFFIFVALIGLVIEAQAFTLIRPGIVGFDDETVSVHLNSNCTSNISGELNEAIDFWNAAPNSSLKLERGADVSYITNQLITNQQLEPIVISCSSDIGVELPGVDPDGSLAVGISRDIDSDSAIDIGYVVINLTPSGLANYNNASAGVRQLVLVHEFGHALGLGHSSEVGAIMYFSVAGKGEPYLHQDDIDGIRHLYPQNELRGDYLLGCGMIRSSLHGSPQGPPAALLLLLLPLILIIRHPFSRA